VSRIAQANEVLNGIINEIRIFDSVFSTHEPKSRYNDDATADLRSATLTRNTCGFILDVAYRTQRFLFIISSSGAND
jgi:hypothetical protein